MVVFDLAKKKRVALHDSARVGKGEGGRYALAFSPDGARAFLALPSRGAEVYSVVTDEARVLPGLPRARVSAAFSPDGGRIAYETKGNGVTVWDLDRPRRLWGLAADATRCIMSLAFSADGRFLLVGDLTSLRIVDAGSGKVRAELETEAAALATLPGGGSYLVGRQWGLLRGELRP